MNFNPFKRNKTDDDIQVEWTIEGAKYAAAVNEMKAFGEKNGWENWKGKDPKDTRGHLSDKVIDLLRKANAENTVEEFRNKFPPGHSPFIKYFQEKGQTIEHIHFIENEKIVFLTGTAFQKRQAYILDGDRLTELSEQIDGIGKSEQESVFAIQIGHEITTTQGWQGEVITTFQIRKNKGNGITQLIPFNDGLKVLSITNEGIYLLSGDQEKMIHPKPDPEDEEWDSNIDMENGALSRDNKYIVVGDQCANHRILDMEGNEIREIGPQSSYSNFCLFSADDSQLITSSCHFYNGITIGVKTNKLSGLKIEAYEENDAYRVIDEEMRVYSGVAYDKLYVLGDAYGYITAIDGNGNQRWRHFLGSSIGGIAISDDRTTLWVASCTGIIHKLRLGKGHRDDHTIGNGNHYEEFRLILWKGEEKVLLW